MPAIEPLDPSILYKSTQLDSFNFETTDDLQDPDEAIGQPRAVDALRFGVGIQQEGYNIFALGPAGTGKRSMIRHYFEESAKNDPVPSDWCYVYNFKDRHKPQALSLRPGQGRSFRRDMDNLVEELRTALSSAFDSDEFRTRRQVIEQEFQERQEKSLEELQERSRQRNLSLLRTPGGLVFAPLRNGETLSPEEFQSLPEEERQEIEKTIEEFQRELQNIVQMVPTIQREIRDRLKELNHEFINYSVGDLISDLRQKYDEHKDITDYLQQVEEDVVENANDFLAEDEDQAAGK
jgi:hypothetical protein